MSTIASSRPSITLSSRRTSASTDTTTTLRSSSLPRPPPSITRRNRAALREFYGLKGQEGAAAASTSIEERIPESELDKPGFNAGEYVKNVLAKESLESVMKVEAGLVSGKFQYDGNCSYDRAVADSVDT